MNTHFAAALLRTIVIDGPLAGAAAQQRTQPGEQHSRAIHSPSVPVAATWGPQLNCR